MTAFDDVFTLMINSRACSWDEAARLLARLRTATVADVADWLESAGEPAAAGLLRRWGVPDPGWDTDGTTWATAFIPHGDKQHRVLICESRVQAEGRVVQLRDSRFDAWLVGRQWRDDEASPWVGFDLAGAAVAAGAVTS